MHKLNKYAGAMVRGMMLVGLMVLAAFGMMDPALAAGVGSVFMLGDVEVKLGELEKAMKGAYGTMEEKVKASQDAMQKAIDELKRGDDIHAKTADELKKTGEAGATAQKEFKEALNTFAERMKEVEQKLDRRPGPGDMNPGKTAGALFVESEEYKALLKKTNGGQSKNGWDSGVVDVERKTAILNLNPLTNDQPLVRPERYGQLIGPGLRRFTIRDLLPSVPTASNLIEFASELVFTNNAAPQFDNASAGSTVTEGALKNESALSFQLANAAVTTIAHFIPASRQVVGDAPSLQGYINQRLIYGLKLEEEDELLNGSGVAGKLSGLRTQMTAFAGGATNQTAIDTLLKAFTQISLSYFEASGVVLHPVDWQNILLLKDTQGRYLFGDPHGFTTPAIWGKPVVPTQAIAASNFLAGAFDMAAMIWDRESISIRVAEQHADWFARNLIAILCEERLALTVFRAQAIVGGGLNYAG